MATTSRTTLSRTVDDVTEDIIEAVNVYWSQLFPQPEMFVVDEAVTAAYEPGDHAAVFPVNSDEDVALVLVHSGGQKGSGVLTKLRKLGPVTEVKSAELRASEYPSFVINEARSMGARRSRTFNTRSGEGRGNQRPDKLVGRVPELNARVFREIHV